MIDHKKKKVSTIWLTLAIYLIIFVGICNFFIIPLVAGHVIDWISYTWIPIIVLATATVAQILLIIILLRLGK